MGSGGRDHHRDITHHERSNPMAEKHLRVRMTSGEVRRDPYHLLFGHGAIGLVFQPIHPVALVFVAHDTHEEGESAVSAAPNDAQ